MATTTPKALPKKVRIRGRITDINGGTKLAGKSVFLWGKSRKNDTPVLLLSAKTDKWGNFFGDVATNDYEGYGITLGGASIAYPFEVNDKSYSNATTEAPAVEARREKVAEYEDTGTQNRPYILDPGSLGTRVINIPVSIDASTEQDDCECHAQDNTPRNLPNAEELVGSYSQDIGGNCIDFTTPNRALEEFAYTTVVRVTTPEVVSYTLSQLEGSEEEPENPVDDGIDFEMVMGPPQTNADGTIKTDQGTRYLGKNIAPGEKIMPPKIYAGGGISRETRMFLDKTHKTDWDNTPTIFQSVEIAFGHLLTFKQVWKADGYSLGDLLYSTPLAPGQKKQIAIFDWDRTESNLRSEEMRYEEALDAHLSHDRDVNEIAKAVLSERMDGKSTANTKGKSGGFGVAGGGFGPGFFLGAAGGASWNSGSSSSTAMQQSSRNASSQAMQNLREKVMQSSSAVRNQRSTVVQTVRQGERTKAQTEIIANYNHCHAVTIQHFEVLRHFALETELADVKECVFVPMPMTLFNGAKVMRWLDILKPIVEDFARENRGDKRISELPKGLDSLERIYNHYAWSDMPTGAYAEEEIQEVWGEFEIKVRINRPADRRVEPVPPGTDTQAYLDLLHRYGTVARFIVLNTTYEIDQASWQPYFALTGMDMEELQELFENKNQTQRNQIFNSVIAPRIAEALVNDSLNITLQAGQNGQYINHSLSADCTLLNGFEDGGMDKRGKLRMGLRDSWQTLKVSFNADTDGQRIRRLDVKRLLISTSAHISSMNHSKAMVTNVNIQYRCPHFAGPLLRGNVKNDLDAGDNVSVPTPLSSAELVNPRMEDVRMMQQLLHHLNARLEEYHKAIWYMMDSDRRFMILDGIKVKIPNFVLDTLSPTDPPGTIKWHIASYKEVALASIIENNLIGILGNSLVLPLAHGQHATGPSNLSLKQMYMPDDLPAPFRVSVPTRGVFAEAVQGACNSCEKIDDTRFWKWEEHPLPDDPTAINPLSMDSRYQQAQNMMPSNWAQQMTSYQNVPEAPAFQGANALVSMLSNPNLFRDLSGLDANQANALQALITAANSAQGFTQQASNMANTAAGLNSQKMKQDHQEKMDKQKFAQQNYDKIKTNLDDQKKNGSITPEEYDKRLKELNDLTLGEVETPTTGTSNNGVSTTGNSGQQLAQTVQGITTALTALQGNPAAQNALIQAITGLTPDLLAEIDAALGNYSTGLVS